MKPPLLTFYLLFSVILASHAQTLPIPECVIKSAFAEKSGTLVIIDCSTQSTQIFNEAIASEKLPPCSTFKIWNTLIGSECKYITTPADPFYKWDGEKRFIPEWNKDLTLKEAFGVSCVPAFQVLARKIGPHRMQSWINKIGYGDQDLSAGVDVFWLPKTGRKTIMITPKEQAMMIRQLVCGDLPFSKKSKELLKEVMYIRMTQAGNLYGKTGSGSNNAGTFNLGWFVGYLEKETKTYAFACAVKGDNCMGKDARAIVESLFP